MKDNVIISFGRMNPMTNGHEKLATKLQSVAKQKHGDAMLYLSHSTNPKKDPLDFDTKVKFAKKAFGPMVKNSPARTILEVAKELTGKYKNLIVVVGSDRVSEFQSLLTKYNGKDYKFENIEVVSAGERDPDAEGVTGMSGSKMRAFASANDFEKFKQGVPSKLSDADAKALFTAVRKGMKLDEQVDEAVLGYAQRRQRAARFKRMQQRLQRARMLQSKRAASGERLKRRAGKLSYQFFRKRASAGKDYASMSPGEKIALDTRLQKSVGAIRKLASRLVPLARKRDIQRRQSIAMHRNEELNFMFSESFIVEATKVPQDPQIKGKEGTQPKVYYKGLDKDTKEKRLAHFRKYGPMSDRDPNAYVDAPGDKEAREKGMPQSKHTQKYKQMYGEAVAPQERQKNSRLEQLVRLGLADAKMLSTIKRAVAKLKSGDTMTPQEREATNNLLSTMLDMVTSADALFRMTKTQLQKESYVVEKGEYDDYEEIDGLEMAQIEVENIIQDSEDLLEMMDEMDEEPEAWVLSKITKAADYISSVRDYLQFEDDYDYENGEEEEDDGEYGMEDEMEVEDYLASMTQEEFEDDEDLRAIFEEVEGLKKKAEKSGISYSILKQVYNRGMAAWQTGHRPGTTAQQWAFARVNSFITKGKGTWGGADSDLAAKVKKIKDTNEAFSKFASEALEWGTDELRKAYATATPGQSQDIIMAKYSANSALDVMNNANTQRLYKLYSEEQELLDIFAEVSDVSEAFKWHQEESKPLYETVYRVGSEKYFEFWRTARQMYNEGLMENIDPMDKAILEETDLGEIVEHEGSYVPLDCPMLEEGLNIWKYNPVSGLWKIERDVTPETKDKWLEIYKKDDPKGKYVVSAKKPSSKAHLKEEDEKNPPLNEPKRGGPKKFYVYVKDPSSGNIKKVTWGDTTGLSVKLNDPEARKSFAARHQCSMQKDRTSAAYWACNTPRYAKQLGLSGGGDFYW
ncbi:hypothetical protein EBS02_00670 [bacterium]|nr:hypothetical protein [bacterium]